MLFSTGSSTNGATTNSSGSVTISYLGSPDGTTAPGVYFGNAVGMWNPSSGVISGQFWGSYTLSGTNNTTTYPEIYNTPTFPVAIPIITNQVVGTNIVSSTNYINVEPVGSNSFNDAAMMNGSFDGNTANNYPNQTFTAQGHIAQQQLYPQQVDTNEGTTPVQVAAPLQIPVTVQGVRVADSYSTFNTVSNSIPYSLTTYTITNIPSPNGGL